MNANSQEQEIIVPQLPQNTMVEMVAKAEIDQQIATAKQYPRSIKLFMDEARAMVTLNEKIAESCNYGLPRGGKIIEGPSVRFAEIILSAWGNCRAGTRVIHEDGRFITAQGVCHDLQRNTLITKEVKRRITDKYGKTYNEDMIGVTGNAASSIGLRNAILAVIPKAFWEPLYDESRKVAMGDAKTLSTRRADALAIMQKFGVTLEMVLAKFDIKGAEDITLEHLGILNACKNSIKNGETTAEELFAVPSAAADESRGNAGVKEKMKGKKKSATPHDPVTGEVTPSASDSSPSNEGAKSEVAAAAKPAAAAAEPEQEAVPIPEPKLDTAQDARAAGDALVIALVAAPLPAKGAVFVRSHGTAIVEALKKFGDGLVIGKIRQHVKLPD